MNDNRYICIKCNDDYLVHQTIIADHMKRCVCLNCWSKTKHDNFSIKAVKLLKFLLETGRANELEGMNFEGLIKEFERCEE